VPVTKLTRTSVHYNCQFDKILQCLQCFDTVAWVSWKANVQ